MDFRGSKNTFRLPEKGRAMARMKTTAFGILLVTWSLTTTGCFWGFTEGGPSLGILSVPIPVSPFFQDEKEDKYWEHERYERVPILGPITSGNSWGIQGPRAKTKWSAAIAPRLASPIEVSRLSSPVGGSALA